VGLSLAGIGGSNPFGFMYVSVVSVVCCQVGSLRRADRWSRGVLLSAVCVTECDQVQQ
jgi:hypothetical protein